MSLKNVVNNMGYFVVSEQIYTHDCLTTNIKAVLLASLMVTPIMLRECNMLCIDGATSMILILVMVQYLLLHYCSKKNSRHHLLTIDVGNIKPETYKSDLSSFCIIYNIDEDNSQISVISPDIEEEYHLFCKLFYTGYAITYIATIVHAMVLCSLLPSFILDHSVLEWSLYIGCLLCFVAGTIMCAVSAHTFKGRK